MSETEVSPDATTVDATPPASIAPGRPDAVPAPKLTRRGRLRKWDRPPPPHDWRWYVGNLGKILIAVGLLMFGFVAYQLWGTAIENAQAQRALENEFEELLAEAPAVGAPVVGAGTETVTTTASDGSDVDAADATGDETTDADVVVPDASIDGTPGDPAPEVVVPVEDQNIPTGLENGDALARIEIPRIGVNDIVVAGVDTNDLKRGPGHFPDTPLPGQLGNSAIAGHRTTYGQPFFDIDKLEVGDEIRVTTLSGVFVYRVTGQQIVSPSDYQVVATVDPTVANLTLTSCHPKWTARERIVIFSELDPVASAAVGEPVLNYGRPDEEPVADESADEAATDDAATDAADDEIAGDAAPATLPGDGVDDGATATGDGTGGVSGSLTDEGSDAESLTDEGTHEEIADAFAEGWFSDPAAYPQVALWGLLLSVIAIGAYLLSRRFKRDWVGALVGILPFVVALYFFFQNVNRLLPPNL